MRLLLRGFFILLALGSALGAFAAVQIPAYSGQATVFVVCAVIFAVLAVLSFVSPNTERAAEVESRTADLNDEISALGDPVDDDNTGRRDDR